MKIKNKRVMVSLLSMMLVFGLLFPISVNAQNNDKGENVVENSSTVKRDEEVLPLELYEDLCIDDKITSTFSSEDSISKDVVVNIETTADELIAGLLTSNLEIEGTVTTDTVTIDINDYYDFDNTDSFTIANWAFEQQLVTEVEKYEVYCKLIESSCFQNIDCVTGVINELKDVYNDQETPYDIKKMIEGTIDLSTDTQRSIQFSLYETSNFSVYYDPRIQVSEVIKVASYFETVRTQFINMGFRQPIKETGKTRWEVELKYTAHTNGATAATAHKNPCSGNTCACAFILYSFTTFTTAVKERIAHEYFHGIQFAYNYDYNTDETAWFAEAMANWSKITVSGTSSTCNDSIDDYILSRKTITSQHENIHYGTVLFPLTIDYLYEGYSTIRRIYEEYADYPVDLTFDQLRDIIDDALEYVDGSFDEAYCTMANYKYSPAEYFAPIHPGGSAGTNGWSPRVFVCNTSIFHAKDITPSSVVTARSIQSYSSDYFQFNPNELCQDALLKITITFNGTGASDGICYSHVEKSDGTKTFTKLTKTGTNTYSASFSHYGGSIQSVGLIVSNLYTDAVTYSVTCLVEQGTTETLTIGSSNRYTEKIMSLGEREYKDFVITFTTGGNRVLQTFGTNDTYLELFNMNGTKLAGNSSTDDAGYATNALISYDFTANTQYRIRVTFYSSTQSGDIKLAIIPTYSTDTYEDIYTLNDYTLGLTSSYLRYNVNMYVYKYTSSRELTMNLSSSVVDTYLYIIDPRSTAPIEEANQDFPDMTKNAANLYNDDAIGSSNSQIKKRFYPNVAYLVIAAQYNPSSTSAEGELYIDFE